MLSTYFRNNLCNLELSTLLIWFEFFLAAHWSLDQTTRSIASELEVGITPPQNQRSGFLSGINYQEVTYLLPATSGSTTPTRAHLVVVTATMPSLLGFSGSLMSAAPIPSGTFQGLQ